jgi:tRNA A-37 threonylcarbamoyl transferase component Bud32
MENILKKGRSKKYLKKFFRESEELVCRKNFRRFMLCKRGDFTPAMAAFLSSPDKVLDKLKAGLLKKGRGSTVGRVRIDDHDLVVKRYNTKGFWHALRRCIRATRAAHSWRNAHRLLMLDISTPRPVALLEKRFGPLRSTAYFINEYVEGPRAVDFFEDRILSGKREVAQSIAEIVNKLGAAGISHGDMKATNIIIHKQEPALVDLDAMRVHACPRRFTALHRKDVKRFLKNWRDAPEVGDLFSDLIE